MYDRKRVKFLVEQELDLFPKASLLDLYKLFYQNCCGSRHFFQNLASVEENILTEIAQVENNGILFPDYDISYIFPVRRISLYSIINGRYDIHYVADKFYQLSVQESKISLQEWINEWEDIQEFILTYKPFIFDDLNTVMLDYNQPSHHSQTYRLNYNPHYRICSY